MGKDVTKYVTKCVANDVTQDITFCVVTLQLQHVNPHFLCQSDDLREERAPICFVCYTNETTTLLVVEKKEKKMQYNRSCDIYYTVILYSSMPYAIETRHRGPRHRQNYHNK